MYDVYVCFIRDSCIFYRLDGSVDELDDQELQKLLIVTQTPAAVVRKHPGGDRTGNFMSRPKMTAELAMAINDGLFCYEQVGGNLLFFLPPVCYSLFLNFFSFFLPYSGSIE